MNEEAFFDKLKYKSEPLEGVVRALNANSHIGIANINENFIIYDAAGTTLLLRIGEMPTSLLKQQIIDTFGISFEDYE